MSKFVHDMKTRVIEKSTYPKGYYPQFFSEGLWRNFYEIKSSPRNEDYEVTVYFPILNSAIDFIKSKIKEVTPDKVVWESEN